MDLISEIFKIMADDVVDLENQFNEIIGTLLVIVIIFGILQCFLGYKLYKLWLGVLGFFFGGLMGFAIGSAMTQEIAAGVIIGLISGIILAVLSVTFYFIGSFILGAGLSFVFGYLLTQDIGLSVVLSIVIGIVTIMIVKVMIIVITSIAGGISLGNSTVMALDLIGIDLGAGLSTPVLFLSSFIFSLIGMVYQFKSNQNKNKRALQPTKQSTSIPKVELPQVKPKKKSQVGLVNLTKKMSNIGKVITSSKRNRMILGVALVSVVGLVIIPIISTSTNKPIHLEEVEEVVSFMEPSGGTQLRGNIIDYQGNTYIRIDDGIYVIDNDLYQTFELISDNVYGEFIIYHDKIYYMKDFADSFEDEEIWLARANLDGKDEEKIINASTNSISQYEIINEYIYYSHYDQFKFGKIRIDGNNQQTISLQSAFNDATDLNTASFNTGGDFVVFDDQLYTTVSYYYEHQSGEVYLAKDIIVITPDDYQVNSIYSADEIPDRLDNPRLRIIDMYDGNIIFTMQSDKGRDENNHIIYDFSYYSINVDGTEDCVKYLWEFF